MKWRHFSSVAGAAVVTTAALTGCSVPSDTIDGGPNGPAVSGMSPCAEAFPLAMGEPDPSSLTLVPADWPAEPHDAVLCSITVTATGEQQSASYALAEGSNVLAHYAATIPAEYDPQPTETGRGEALTGSAEDITFVVEPRDNGFTLTFQENQE